MAKQIVADVYIALKQSVTKFELGLLPFPIHLDRSRIEAVEQAEDGGDDEEGLDAEGVPDPATEEGNEDGDEVIDRNAC